MVAAVIGQYRLNVCRAEIQGRLAIIQQQHAFAKIGATNGEGKKPLYGSSIALLDLRLWHVAGAIRVNDEVNDRALEPNIVQVNSRLQKGDNVQSHVGAIGVCVRQLIRPFASVDGQIAGFKFKPPQVPVKRPELNPAAGDVFQSADHLAAHKILEPRAPQVPDDGDNDRQQHDTDPRLNPEASVRASDCGLFRHFQLAPEALGWSAGTLTAGIGTLVRISACCRRLCSHASSSSSMCCWVSSSRILGSRSSKETTLPPAFSRSGSSWSS